MTEAGPSYAKSDYVTYQFTAAGLSHGQDDVPAPDLGTPSKVLITPEMRERMERNRKVAEERKAELKRKAYERAQEASEAKRAAGERSLREFGIRPTSFRPPERSYSAVKPKNSVSNPVKLDLDDESDFFDMDFEITEHYIPDPQCSEDQLKVLELVQARRNVFFTGSAGVGKSFMLHEIVRMLKMSGRKVSVTAPTGIAALAIDGRTIYSWAKVKLGKGSVYELYNDFNVKDPRKLGFKNRRPDGKENKMDGMASTDVLIVDEISMLQPELFEKISILCQAVRSNRAPFGGIQLILSGDFFQLPPVQKDHNFSCMYCGCPQFKRIKGTDKIRCVRPFNTEWEGQLCGIERTEYRFCFETPTWRQLDLAVIELHKVFRQEDNFFIEVLNKIRRGIVDDQVENMMRSCTKPLADSQIKPTQLFSRNANVDAMNARQFDLLKEECHEFTSRDEFGDSDYSRSFASRLNDLQARKTLKLKIGTQVLLLANIDVSRKLVNGSRGVVIDWRPMPSYGAISKAVSASERLKEQHKAASKRAWADSQSNEVLPLVLFADGHSTVIEPYLWDIEIDLRTNISRTQLPLSHAWALTVHKAQGQSLDRLCVDLTGVFEEGQAYVALSRARTLQGLQVSGWRKFCVKANQTVIQFSDSLSNDAPFGDVEVPFLNKDDFFRFKPTSEDELVEPSCCRFQSAPSDWVFAEIKSEQLPNKLETIDEPPTTNLLPSSSQTCDKIPIHPLLINSNPPMSSLEQSPEKPSTAVDHAPFSFTTSVFVQRYTEQISTAVNGVKRALEHLPEDEVELFKQALVHQTTRILKENLADC